MNPSSNCISAVLPIKNGQTYLKSLLPNILAMLSPNDELIVVNDGSTDQTKSITEDFCELDSRIKLINTHGVGLVCALNLGIESASYDWIARFDVDDDYTRNRLDEERSLLGDDVSVIFSDYQFISNTGMNLGSVYSAIFPLPTLLSLFSSQRTAHPSALINKKFLIQCGGYLQQDYPAEDLALWLRLSHYGKILSIPKTLLLYRLSGASISAQSRKTQLIKKEEIILDYEFWSLWQDKCIHLLDETILGYLSMPNTPERILLHLRDLRMVAGLTDIKVPYKQILAKIGLAMFFRMIYAMMKITYYTILRRAYRFIKL